MKNVDKRVGVFMRVYRNEPEIHKAIQSVLSQTYENIRYYILVNEKTIDLVNRYAQEDMRIEAIEGKEGEGFRNYAKYIARKNAYVTTIDGDDWYDKTYIEELVNCAEKKQLDIVACGNYFVDSSARIVGERKQIDMAWNRKDTNMVLEYIYAFFRTIWGKLMASRVVLTYDENRLPLSNEYGGYGGDTLFMFNILYEAEGLGICSKVLYYYRISETSSSYQLKQGRLDSDEILFEFVKKFLQEMGSISEETLLFLYQVYGNALGDTTRLLLKSELDSRQRVEKLIYIYEKEITRQLLYKDRTKKLVEYDNKLCCFTEKLYHLIFDSLSNEQRKRNIASEYKELFCLLYPKWKDILSTDEFFILFRKGALLDACVCKKVYEIICELVDEVPYLGDNDSNECMKIIRKLNSNMALIPVLQKKEFVLEYADIVKKVVEENEEEAIEMCSKRFARAEYPKYAEMLIELWINLAALANNPHAFVDGKKMKLKVLIDCGKSEEARNELADLEEMGIK